MEKHCSQEAATKGVTRRQSDLHTRLRTGIDVKGVLKAKKWFSFLVLSDDGNLTVVNRGGAGGKLVVTWQSKRNIFPSPQSPAADLYTTGFQQLTVGLLRATDEWGPGFDEDSHVTELDYTTNKKNWKFAWTIGVNDKNFPVLDASLDSLDSSEPVHNGPFDPDVEAFMVGVYGSAVGCLATFDSAVSPKLTLSALVLCRSLRCPPCALPSPFRAGESGVATAGGAWAAAGALLPDHRRAQPWVH